MSSSRATSLASLRDPDVELDRDGTIVQKSRSARIVEAARSAEAPNLADQIAKTEALYAAADTGPSPVESDGYDLDTGPVEQALSEPTPAKPLFTTHSQAFLGMLMAQEVSLKETAANVRAKIVALEAEYTDVMLAESGVTAAINAIKSGR